MRRATPDSGTCTGVSQTSHPILTKSDASGKGLRDPLTRKKLGLPNATNSRLFLLFSSHAQESSPSVFSDLIRITRLLCGQFIRKIRKRFGSSFLLPRFF